VPTFSRQELLRYARHFSLPEVGFEGQQKLQQARVLCIGAGGLGCAALSYLAAAGVGQLGIVDGDTIDLTNLQRQILYSEKEVGCLKVDIAKEKLLAINSHIIIHTSPVFLTEENVFDIFSPYDVILDCTDNFPARYLVNDACVILKKPNVFASILGFEGQCSVFCVENYPCYRCLYPSPPPSNLIPNCAEAGVLSVLPGLLGTIQAIEAIKLILTIGRPLLGRFLCVKALDLTFQEFEIKPSKNCPLCQRKIPFAKLERGQKTCANTIQNVPQMNVNEFLKCKEDVFLLDVREPYEAEICHLNGYLIPLLELKSRLNEIPRNKIIVVHCKSGHRSQKAVQLLMGKGYLNVYNLTGGILEWIRQIDSTLSKY